ncbi:unnamed protein product [Leuciscus chuanchicus]
MSTGSWRKSFMDCSPKLHMIPGLQEHGKAVIYPGGERGSARNELHITDLMLGFPLALMRRSSRASGRTCVEHLPDQSLTHSRTETQGDETETVEYSVPRLKDCSIIASESLQKRLQLRL